jgi:hypothetical protein
MFKKVTVGSLLPNPFRKLDDYPIDKSKVNSLKESILETGFWGTIIARPKGAKYEIAFGHHRVASLKELIKQRKMKASDKVEVIVRKLDDETMLKVMARENLEEWGSDAYVESQTLESTIKAYGDGKIDLGEVPKDTNKKHIRHAPSGRSERSYTKQMVGEFLGWVGTDGELNNACRIGFQILDAIEAKLVTRKQLKKLDRTQARDVVKGAIKLMKKQKTIAAKKRKESELAKTRAKQAKSEREKKKLEAAAAELERMANVADDSATAVGKGFAKDMVDGIKAGKLSSHDVREEASERTSSLESEREQRALEASEHYKKLCKDVCKMLNPSADKQFKSLKDLLKMDCGLNQNDIENLDGELEALTKRITTFRKALKSWTPKAADTSEEPARLLPLVG